MAEAMAASCLKVHWGWLRENTDNTGNIVIGPGWLPANGQ